MITDKRIDGIEVLTVAVISTGHLSRDTMRQLERASTQDAEARAHLFTGDGGSVILWGLIFVPDRGYGWRMHIREDDANFRAAEAPTEIVEMYYWALARNIDWVHIDRDGEAYPGTFKLYEE